MQEVSNVNDLKVVSFHNSESFDFTPEFGCMYDGRPVNGKSGAPGIQAGETVLLPYHVGNRLATNLAKRVFNTSKAATVDPQGIPTGVPIWNETMLQERANTYLTDMYSEEKPIAQSETDVLMAKVEALNKMVEDLAAKDSSVKGSVAESSDYQDKQEVITELEKREIAHDKRKSKAELEKLLA